MCPRQVKAVSIEGHPNAAFNGVYTHDSTHEGWPVLKNANGMYCYRYTPNNQWRVGSEHNPDKGACRSTIVAKEGPLPVGAHTWRLGPSVLGKPPGSAWEDRTVTVALVPA